MGGCYMMMMMMLMMICKQGAAEQHVVGGKSGWDESTDFHSWSSAQTFILGDSLLFKYSAMHSVAELSSEKAYENCDVGTALNTMNDGNSVVKLTKTGTRYFACGTAGHCQQGMKVKVSTVASASSASPSSSSSSSPSSSSPSSSSNGSASISSASSSSSVIMAIAAAFLGLCSAFMLN